MKLKNTIGFALMAEHNIVTSIDTVKINDYNELVVGDRIVHDLGPQYIDSVTTRRKHYYANRSSDAVLNSKHSGHSSLTKDCRVGSGKGYEPHKHRTEEDPTFENRGLKRGEMTTIVAWPSFLGDRPKSNILSEIVMQGGFRRGTIGIISDETPISKSHFPGTHLREWLDGMRTRLENIRERAAEISQGLIVQNAPTNRGASMHMINMVAGAGGHRELQVRRAEPLVLGGDRYEYTKMGVRDKHARDFQPWMRG